MSNPDFQYFEFDKFWSWRLVLLAAEKEVDSAFCAFEQAQHSPWAAEDVPRCAKSLLDAVKEYQSAAHLYLAELDKGYIW